MKKSTTPEWLSEGLSHVWLPYAQMQNTPEPLPVISAKDCTLTLADGRTLIDGISSWWSVCHGYQHPHLVKAIQQQAESLSHVMFAGLAHEPAYRLTTRLAKMAPEGLNRVFFSDSGSTAVEVAMKMAVQYGVNQGKKHKTKFISFRNGYHGDTMGAMSLSDPDRGMHKIFAEFMPKQICIDIPTDEYSFAEFSDLLADARIHGQLAGVIIEPLVQGAGGFKFHTPDVLAEIFRITKQHGLIFIADEIATGFYRTGMSFACQEASITPDILCIGKALTGGMISLGATLATDSIFNSFLSDSIEQAFMHGPTYMANPLACAAANASLDLFENEPRSYQVQAIEGQLESELQECATFSSVADVRVKGAIGVVQLKQVDWPKTFELRKTFVEKGVWLRPFSDVIYVMPAYTITSKELSTLTQAIVSTLRDLE